MKSGPQGREEERKEEETGGEGNDKGKGRDRKGERGEVVFM